MEQIASLSPAMDMGAICYYPSSIHMDLALVIDGTKLACVANVKADVT